MATIENVACLVGVAAMIQRFDGKVLLGLRPVEKVWAGFGGKLQSNELPEEGLRRELLEELGISVPHMSQLGFGWGQTPAGKKFTVLYFHVMLPAGAEPRLMEETAASHLSWFDLQNLPEEMWERERTILGRMAATTFVSDAEISQVMSAARSGAMLRDGSTSFRIARAVERLVAPRAAQAALDAAAREFDRRAAPACGFYEPDEPAAILRQLPASLVANMPQTAESPSFKDLLAWLYSERYSEGMRAWMQEIGLSKSADSLTLAAFEEAALAQLSQLTKAQT